MTVNEESLSAGVWEVEALLGSDPLQVKQLRGVICFYGRHIGN
jgi:hypothetical protein